MIDKNSAEWKWGRWGEEIVADFFENQGYIILPLMNIERNGGAPLFLSRQGNRVALDLGLMRAGKIIFAESKWKQAPVRFMKARPPSWRHGIDTWKWKEYQAAEKQLGALCLLVFLEQRSETCAGNQGRSRVLLADFETLRQYECPSLPGNNYSDLTYWDIDKTPFQIFNLDCAGIPTAMPNRKVNPWERPSKDGRLPRERMIYEKGQQPSLFETVPREREPGEEG
jgi:hypothetical protein